MIPVETLQQEFEKAIASFRQKLEEDQIPANPIIENLIWNYWFAGARFAEKHLSENK